MNINDLEKNINFIWSNYNIINPFLHYPIEVYSNDYNDIFVFWEDNKKNKNIKQEVLKQKISSLQSLNKIENNFITLTSLLETKFNHNKINNKLNKILKIITFGCVDLNKKIERKITILQKIKQIKQQNLVKISELMSRINNINIKNINENGNFTNNIDVTNSFKLTLS